MINSKELIPVSPSRAKTLQSCSFLYYCTAILKLPENTNLGALRGTVLHSLLELLCLPKHQKFIDKLLEAQNPEMVPAICRFLDAKIKQFNIPPNELVKPISKKAIAKTNRQEIHDMLMVIVNQELSKKNSQFIATEFKFDFIFNKIRLKGFIDKVSIEGDTLVISDWKSSSKKFVGDDLSCNLQGMIYSLIARKEWPGYKKYLMRFMFARFPKNPYQELEFTDEQLDGLIYYLEHVSATMNKMDEKLACSNFAADSVKTKWLCGAGPTWRCPMRDPFHYWQIINKKTNKISKNGFVDGTFPGLKENEVLEFKHYSGCPRWKKLDNCNSYP